MIDNYFKTSFEENKNEKYKWEDVRKLAYEIAKKAHEGQKRKSGEDYFLVHPVGVADIITEHFIKNPAIELDSELERIAEAVSYMHDVVEDTNQTLDDIEKKFGLKIRMIMESLSENKGLRKIHEDNIKITEEGKIPTVSEDKNFMKESMLRDSLEKINRLKEDGNMDFYKVAAMVRIADIIQNLSDYDIQPINLQERNLQKAKIIFQEFENDIDLAQELKNRIDEIEND